MTTIDHRPDRPSCRSRGSCRLALATALLLTGLAAASPARAETVTGTFRYADSDGTLRPIAFANVEVWRFRPTTLFIWTWNHDLTTTTDGDGQLSAPMPFVTSGVVYAVRVTATNYAAVVWPNDVVHTVPFHNEPGEPDGAKFTRVVSGPADTLDFTYDFVDGWTPQHFNLAETVRHGFDYVAARRDPAESDPLPAAAVQPTSVSASPGGTFYNPATDTLVIDSSEVFNDFIVLHEYGHFVEEQIGSFAPIPSIHNGCTASGPLGGNSPEHAWMEGFADFLAMAVAVSLPPGTLTPTLGRNGLGTSSITVLETPPPCSASTPDAIENMVAGSLWDLFDDPADSAAQIEADDTISRQDDFVVQILDRELDTNTWPTINHFRDAWHARGLRGGGLDMILRRHGILPSSPPIGSFDRIDEAGTAFGWALDPDAGGSSIDVHIYLDGPAGGGGTFIGSATANQPRGDVNQVTGYPGDHGFSFTIPAAYHDGQPHSLYVHGIDIAGGNSNDLLPGSPISFLLGGKVMAVWVESHSRTITKETITVHAYNPASGASVSGTVSTSGAVVAPTGQPFTYTHSVRICDPERKPPCQYEPIGVEFTVDAPGYQQLTFLRYPDPSPP